MFLRRLIRNKLAVFGAGLLLFLVAMAVLAPWVATHNPFKLNIKERLQPPSSAHLFGTDGYGRSDSRAALRDFFEVDRRYIAVAALRALADEGAIKPGVVRDAIERLGVDPERPNPVNC